jgi:hypothetical protein
MLYFTLNQSHGEVFRIFDHADVKIIRVKKNYFYFWYIPECVSTL